MSEKLSKGNVMKTYDDVPQVDKISSDIQFAHSAYSLFVLLSGLDKELAKTNLEMAINVLEKSLVEMKKQVK